MRAVPFARLDVVDRDWRRRLPGPPFPAAQSLRNEPARLHRRFSARSPSRFARCRRRRNATSTGGAAPGCFLPNGPRRISARQRTLNHKASCRKPRITCHSGRAEEYLFDDIPRLRRGQSFAKISERSVHVSIENFAEELLLVAKSSVKTWPIDAHGPSQVGERGAFVTFGPKNVHGAFEGRVRIEGARSSAAVL